MHQKKDKHFDGSGDDRGGFLDENPNCSVENPAESAFKLWDPIENLEDEDSESSLGDRIPIPLSKGIVVPLNSSHTSQLKKLQIALKIVRSAGLDWVELFLYSALRID